MTRRLVDVDALTVVSASHVAGGRTLHADADCPRNITCPVWVSLGQSVTVSERTSPDEWAAIGHLRGWRHDGWACPICKPMSEASDAQRRLNSVITGSTA